MELAARIGTMAKNGIMKTTITIASDTTNMVQVSIEITARLAEIGIENAVVSYAKNDYSSINNRFLEGIFVGGMKASLPIRYRNGKVAEASWGNDYDGIINIGDVYDVYPIEMPSFTRPWGGV